MFLSRKTQLQVLSESFERAVDFHSRDFFTAEEPGYMLLPNGPHSKIRVGYETWHIMRGIEHGKKQAENARTTGPDAPTGHWVPDSCAWTGAR